MECFELKLASGDMVSGRLHFPENTFEAGPIPLLVCVHGGSYNSEYFDADPRHSILSISKNIGLPVISVDRSGYGTSTPVSVKEGNETYAEAQGRYLDSVILPTIWERFHERAGATAMVVLAHSIGAMMALIAVGIHTADDQYPLAGVIVSGIGSELSQEPRKGMLELLANSKGDIQFDAEVKDAVMLQWPFNALVDASIHEHTARLNKPIPRNELSDINTKWLDMWLKYTSKVNVPVMHGLGKFDTLWVSSQEAIANFKRAFETNSGLTHVRSDIIPQAPHCIELSLQSKGKAMCRSTGIKSQENSL